MLTPKEALIRVWIWKQQDSLRSESKTRSKTAQGRQNANKTDQCGESHSAIIPVCVCVVVTSVLNAIRVDTGCGSLGCSSERIAVAAIIVDVFQVEGVDVTGEVPEDSCQLVRSSLCVDKLTRE